MTGDEENVLANAWVTGGVAIGRENGAAETCLELGTADPGKDVSPRAQQEEENGAPPS